MKKSLMLAACLLSTSAMAAENYAGVQYAMVTYSESDIPDFNPSALVARVGHNFNKNFAVEGRFGIGIADDSNTISGIPVSVEVDQFISVLAKGSLPLGAGANVYGLIGYTDGKITANAFGFSSSASESDTSFGLGIEFGKGDTTGSIEYVNYIDKNDGSLTSINLGVNFAF